MEKPKNIILTVLVWCVQLTMATIMFKAAFAKFGSMPRTVEIFTQIGMEPHGRILIGMLELIAAVLLLIPGGIIYGAFLALGIMTGAIIGHLTDIGVEGIPMALLVFVGCLVIIYIRREESSLFKNMFARN